jgi:hypothetical protein
MNSITQIQNVLKASYTSVQHEANWWVCPKINVVLSNNLKAVLIR